MDFFDLINGIFELGGAFFLMINVKMIRQDKILKGVHWAPTIWFGLWGIFNIFYYSHLDQFLSWIGGLAIVVVNIVWIGHIFYYWNQRRLANV